MACFTAAVAQAIVVHGLKKHLEKNGKHKQVCHDLKLLCTMLLSGSFLLMIEHIYHGEITASFPFLTALNDAGETYRMFYEILTVGGCMDIAITSVWALFTYLPRLLKIKSASLEEKA